MARDNSPFMRQQAKLGRKQGRRAGYDRILIVSEGTKTEPSYFEEIRETYRLNTANVVVRPCDYGTAPQQIVDYAHDLFLKGDLHRKIAPRAFESIFVVFDRDEHTTYHNALQQAESLNGTLKNDAKQKVTFQAIASVPCFELWLLLHFEDIQSPLHRTEAFQRLKKHIPNYDKGMKGAFALTQENLEIACKRAKRLAEKSTAYDGTEPFTDVHSLVDGLVKMEGRN